MNKDTRGDKKARGGKKLLENKWWAKKRGETQRQEGRMRKNKNREQDRCRQREQMKERKNAVQICRKNTQGSNTITTWSQRHTFYNQQSFFSPHTPACTVVTCLLVIHVSAEMIPPLLGLKKTVIIFLGGGVSSPLIFFCVHPRLVPLSFSSPSLNCPASCRAEEPLKLPLSICLRQDPGTVCVCVCVGLHVCMCEGSL